MRSRITTWLPLARGVLLAPFGSSTYDARRGILAACIFGRGRTAGRYQKALYRSGVFAEYHGAGWSSLVARRAHNPKVRGSNPLPATNESQGVRECSLTPFSRPCVGPGAPQPWLRRVLP